MKSSFFTGLLLFFRVLGFGQWTELNPTLTASFLNSGVAYEGKVYFSGGPYTRAVTATPYHDKLEILDLATGTLTTAPGKLSVARASMMCVAHAGKVYFAGGHSWLSNSTAAGQPYNTVDIFDIASKTWSVKQLSVARTEGSAVVLDGKIMFAGGTIVLGTNIISTSVVDVYDPATDQWSVMQLSQKRGGLSAVVIGKQAWFCGGFLSYSAVGSSARIDIYDAVTQQWSQKNLSQSREFPSVAVAGKYVLCAGGYTPAKDYTALVDVFDTSTGTSTTANLSAPRGLMGVATLGTKAYFTGGGHIDYSINYLDKSSNVVDIFDAKTGLWSAATLNKNRMAHVCAAWGNKVVVGGGWRAEQVTTTGSIEVFTDPTIVAVEDAPIRSMSFSLSPNPASDRLQVTFAAETEENGPVTFRILDVAGQLISAGESHATHNSLRIGLEGIAPGFYLLALEQRAGRRSAVQKFAVTRQ